MMKKNKQVELFVNIEVDYSGKEWRKRAMFSQNRWLALDLSNKKNFLFFLLESTFHFGKHEKKKNAEKAGKLKKQKKKTSCKEKKLKLEKKKERSIFFSFQFSVGCPYL
jgi:hypothetical protein